MSNVMQKIGQWAETAAVWAVFMNAVFSTLAAMIGFVLIIADVYISYIGWGSTIQEMLNSGNVAILMSTSLSIVPTLVQLCYVTARIAGLTFITDNQMFYALSLIMLVIDTVADTYQLAHGRPWNAWLLAFGVSLIGLGFFSEYFIGFFTPVSVALWSHMPKINMDIVGGMAISEGQGRAARQQQGRQSQWSKQKQE